MTLAACSLLLWLVLHSVQTTVSAYENLALGGRSTQSSILADAANGYLAMSVNAIDGNQDSNYFHGSCFHSNLELGPWWRVDLLKSYHITSIVITNRGDCCGERLNGAKILVGDSLENNGNNNPSYGQITSLAAGSSQTFKQMHFSGRYVNVVIPEIRQYLHFCEIQVYGYSK